MGRGYGFEPWGGAAPDETLISTPSRAKIITVRLKRVMPSVVHQGQTAVRTHPGAAGSFFEFATDKGYLSLDR